MTLLAFTAAVLALLLAPGPTNTLMALSGAGRGLGGAARLIPAELSGYLTAVLPLAWAGAELLAAWPSAHAVMKVLAGCWVLWLAFRLWTNRGNAAGPVQISAARIYTTTVLNPKALVFGLILLPPFPDPAFPAHLAVFCCLVVGAALLWGAGGALSRIGEREGGGRMAVLQRIAAAWLAAVAVSLLVGAAHAEIFGTAQHPAEAATGLQ